MKIEISWRPMNEPTHPSEEGYIEIKTYRKFFRWTYSHSITTIAISLLKSKYRIIEKMKVGQ